VLPASLRSAVIGAVGRHADQREFDALWAALRGTDNMEDRWLYVGALAATRDAARAKQVLGLALAEWLPPNVATDVPGIVARTPEHGAAAYAFSVEQWPKLSARAGAGVFGERAWLLPSAAGGFNDRAAAARLREDQKRLAGPTGVGPADQMATRIELRAALREREAERLGTALASWSPAR
jgi:hypothetical protein